MGREVAEGLGLVPRDVVTAFIRYQGKVLLLRRSERVGSYPGRWAAVSGYLERDSALAQALVEIDEETGILAESLDLVREGAPLGVRAPERGTLWVVHPFLFELKGPLPEIRLDWESLEARWLDPAEIPALETVPQLLEAWRACGVRIVGDGPRFLRFLRSHDDAHHLNVLWDHYPHVSARQPASQSTAYSCQIC